MERCQPARTDLAVCPTSPVPQADQLLHEQSQHWLRGQQALVETYLERFPDLAADRELVLDLICHEILLRTRRGELPDRADYLRRFPDFADDLEVQFEVHQALSRDGEDPTVLDLASLDEKGSSAVIPMQVGDYEVVRELGRGSMGVVYLARHRELKRQVALKMIQSPAHGCPRVLARFRTEAEVLARLQHPNIVQIYEVGESEGRPFFALEYLPGGGLDCKLKGSPQPPRAAAQLVCTLARAIDAAHQAGVVHRDLKPANVLLVSGGVVSGEWSDVPGTTTPHSPLPTPHSPLIPKITDFGLAKQLDGEGGQTNSGDILGTPCYMAPEQACGRKGAVGPWTDVYSLGAIFYELLTGRPPFNGATVWDTLEQVVAHDPVPPTRLQAKVPRDLEVVCLKCLAKDPARRYSRAADLAEDLRRYLGGEAIRARPRPAWERAWRWVGRHRTLTVLAAASFLSLLICLGAIMVWLEASASQARLEAREARDHEALALALADLKDGLRDVEAARDAQRWKKAATLLDGVSRQLDVAQQSFPSQPALDELGLRTRELRQTIEQQLTVRERLTRFRALRTEAGFLVMGLAGTHLESRQERAGRVVDEAFGLFGIAVTAPALLDTIPDLLTADEQREVHEGCCEMLLGLAQLTADILPGDDSTAPQRGAERALALLDRAAQLEASPGMCHSRRARYLKRLGRDQEARAEEDRSRACSPSRAFEFFLRGSDLYSDGDLAGAVAAFETALSREPNHAAAAYALALPHLRLRLQASQPAVARAHLVVARMSLTACINQQPGLPWPYLCRGFALAEVGEVQAADDDFSAAERILDVRPDDAARYALLVSRGALRIRRGDLAGACVDLKTAIQLRPGDYQAHINLARAYQLRRQDDDALREMDRAITLGPPSALAALHRTRARLHQEAGRTAEAVRDLDQSARLEQAGPVGTASTQAAEDLLAKGRLLAKNQDYAGAVEALDAALTARPNHPPALRARAEAQLRLQRDDEALPDLNRLLEGDRGKQTGTAPLYRARAGVRVKKGDHAGAIEDYTLALAAEPDRAGSHVGRGWSYLALDAAALAESDFDRAVSLDARDGDALNGRGYARVRLGRYREAVADAEQALRLGPPTPRHRYNAARVYAQAFQKAAEDSSLQSPRGRDIRSEYQDRALALLRDALTALPRGKQGEFWSGTVGRDSALNPVRQCTGYRQLAAQFLTPVPEP
jgi:serine/threonine protein kinase/Flp pilus assembly protein TadD